MSTQSSLRLWFLQNPEVDKIASFNVDYMGQNPIECTIYSSASPLDYIEDIAGNITYAKRQTLNFVFACQFPYGDDAIQNMVNMEFFDNLKNWLYEQNKLKNFPQIDEGEVISIMPKETAYLTNVTTKSAIYELQCSLKYEMSDS